MNAPSPPEASCSTRPVKRVRPRRRLVLALSLLAGPLLGEGCLRWLLFSPDPLATCLGAELRKPEYFALPGPLPEYWKLHMRFHAASGATTHPQVDERIGWSRPDLDPQSLLPLDPPSLDGRRPVLCFGASFVACSAASGACWESLFEEHSDLARDHVLVNYGVWGHGVDQTLLLMREVLDAWAPHDPIVAFGFVAETDLYRQVLSAFGWPKPRFEVSDAGHLKRIDPPSWVFDEYLEADPVGITSYAWRAIDINLRGHSNVDLRRRYQQHHFELRSLELSCVLLQEMHRDLEHRGLDHFGIFFHTQEASRNPEACQAFFDTANLWLSGKGPPLINMTPALPPVDSAASSDLSDWYLSGGTDNGHLTELARHQLLPLFEQGIRRQYPKEQRLACSPPGPAHNLLAHPAPTGD